MVKHKTAISDTELCKVTLHMHPDKEKIHIPAKCEQLSLKVRQMYRLINYIWIMRL